MRLQAFALSGLALVLLLASSPSASACHPPPADLGPLCDDWEDPPFGLVPHAEGCVGGTTDFVIESCAFVEETAWELLYGCPTTPESALCA